MRRDIDEAFFFIHDTEENVLHGADGGPFPYETKAAAASAATAKNRRLRTKRFFVVTWITLRRVA